MFRSRVKWYEEGEKNTKYFFSLEKARYNAKTCYKIINDNEEEITNQDEIIEEQRKFYQNLYDIDKDVEFNMKNDYNVYVPEEVRTQQDQQITGKDIEEAIKSMNNNKTPGQDGIPVDFYKVFWNNIKQPFLNMMVFCYDQRTLHSSAREGILNLIPKQNKDTRFIKNLRPITLLNTDYKIIEKAIANKMLPALEHIINKDQRGFMKDRRISVNIRKMLDIMHQVEKQDLEAVVLSLDFVKCFDKCSFSILHGSLDFFKFGKIIKEWTKILYKDFSVKVQNNGHFSERISIKKGVHQGGCCSSVYFLVIAEILALALRQNQQIDGITLQNIKNLLNQFADDMDIFSLCNQQSIEAIYNQLEAFRLQSGFTVSYEKTTLYRIGSLRHSDAQLYGLSQFAWSNNDINVLGVTIAHEDIINKNYGTIVEKVKKVLNAWYNRGLSLVGKVQVVNTLVASLFVYKMMVLPLLPWKTIKTIENTIGDFLWDGKKAKIAYNILQNPKSQGGLNLVHLRNKETALKSTWPKILEKEDEYAQLVYGIIRCKTLGKDIWRCRLHPQDVDQLRISNQFWSNTLKAWCTYNYYNNFRIENQLIWYNSEIKVNKKVIMWADVNKKGLKYVYQLFHQGEFQGEQVMLDNYGLTRLRYNSLKSAMPKEWKEFFQSHNKACYFPIPPHNLDISCNTDNFSKKVYNYLADDSMIIHNKYIKWRIDLGQQYQDVLTDFARSHLDIYHLTNVPKYRSFQYRLLQRGLVTNVQLYKWELSITENCSFCNREKETMIHLFWNCPNVQKLWQELLQYFTTSYGQQKLNLNAEAIIFNRLSCRKSNLANFLCLITKQFIYRQRCLKENLHFPKLKAHIRSVQNMEKYIAVKNNKSHLHDKKWKCHDGNEDLTPDPSIEQYAREYLQTSN